MVELLGISLALAAAVALGLTSIFVRMATRYGSASEIVVYTFLVNVVLLIPITVVVHYPSFGITPRAIAAFVAAGTIGTFAGRALFYRSIETIGASRTEPVKSTQPLHAAIVAAIVLGEALTAANLLGIGLIVVGLLLVSREIVNDNRGTDDVSPVLLVVPLGAAFFFGIEPTFAKLGFAEGTPVLVGLVIKIIAASLAMLAYLRWRRALPPLSISRIDARARRWYLLAGLTNTAFLFVYYAALQTAPVVLVVPIVQMSPLVVVALSLVFLSNLERVTPRLVAASTIIVLGAIVVTLTT